jgi:hypothetical protein
MNTGVVYTTTGQTERGQLASYHRKPEPLFLNKSKSNIDIAGLKKVQQRDVIKFDGMDYSAKFTIGMEVEKNQMSRSIIKEYELFCGFERDGSCGYEAVTHILPLLPAGMWRTKVFDMMHKAEKVIDDRFSPSSRNCGGHITLAVDGMTGDEFRIKIRQYSGIIYSLFRNRLKNSYCNNNKRMLSYSESNDWHHKYQVALVKGNCLEFRLPSRFESVKQMMRRYELMYEVVNFAINDGGKFDKMLKVVMPIIKSMYNNDMDKINEVVRLSKLFQKYILTGEIHEDIREWIRG